MDKKRIHILFQKQLTGQLTAAEQEELQQGMQTLDEEMFSAMVDEYITVEENHQFSKAVVRSRIEKQIAASEKPKPFLSFMKYAGIAAMLLAMLSVTFWLYRTGDEDALPLMDSYRPLASEELLLPEEEALVTLADGTTMLFNELTEDTIRHKGIEIVRSPDGSLVMKQASPINHSFKEDARHRLAAPKGVALHIVLPDSSQVWLNSGSSISVRASFNQANRSVDLEGEGYFDIRHDANKPFYVTAKGVNVKVLGTVFNLSAYDVDNDVRTTLIEGGVDVSVAQNSLTLRPGEQAVVQSDASMTLHKNININQVLAWKDGFFRFKDEPIVHILRELQKWYPISGIEIAEENADRFTGSIRRSKKLVDILDAIAEVSDLSFVIREGRVIVME